MDITSAEMTKYAANSMLATKISFMNDIANLCEIVGADINMVRKGIGSDSRIGNKFIYPGIGYGGSCFPKDVKALIRTAGENKYELRVLKAVEAVNNDQYEALIDADGLALITEWPEFRFPNFKIMKKLLSSPVIFDGRNIYDRDEIKQNGFKYFCIGVDTSK